MNSKETSFRTERRDAAENRQRILNAAVQLFDQFGVEQVSMNQIAIKACVSSGTLYRRYRNKGELCYDLIKDTIDLLFDEIQDYLDKNRSDSPSQRLEKVISLFIRFREKKSQFLAGIEESSSTNPLKSEMSIFLFDEFHQILVKLFDEMNAKEQTHFDSIFRADILLTALSKDSYSFQRDVRGLTTDMISKQLCEIFK